MRARLAGFPIVPALLLAVIVALMAGECSACGFGGICGACGCGGVPCGRKRRSVDSELQFDGDTFKTTNSDLCPRSEWKPIIIENLRFTSAATKTAIEDALARKFEGGNFDVFCANISAKNNYTEFHHDHDFGPTVHVQPTSSTYASNISTWKIPSERLKFASTDKASDSYCKAGNDQLRCIIVDV